MKKTRLRISVAAGIAVIMLCVCCGRSEESDRTEQTENEENIVLTMYGSANDIEESYIQKIIEMYEEESGNTIDIQAIDTGNFNEIVLKKYQIGEIPDLLMCFGGYELEAYNPEETFVDFKDAVWVEDICDDVLGQIRNDDHVYGLPFWEYSTSGCLYNKKIFEEYGLEVPRTQEEFQNVCETLLKKGVQPVYMPAKDGWALFPQFAMDTIFSDEKLLEQLNQNEVTYSEIPEMRSMLEWYQSCAEQGYFGDTYMQDTYAGCAQALGTGKAAMAFLWDTWLYTDYDENEYDYSREDFGIMPAFMGTSETGSFEGGNLNLMLVSKNGDHVEEAKEFVNFMADPENYNRAFDGVYTRAIFKSMETNLETSQSKESRAWIETAGNSSIASRKIAGYAQGDGESCIQQLLAGSIDIDTCLSMMDEQRIEACRNQQIEGY